MSKIIVTAKNIDIAIRKACTKLNISTSELDYTITNKKMNSITIEADSKSLNNEMTDSEKEQAEIAYLNQIKEQQFNTPHCPTCNSTNIKKISSTSKAINTVAFGLLGTKRHKTFHCNNCGYEW